MTLNPFTAAPASGAIVLIRLCVGLIFAGEGVLKFLRPDSLEPGRFNTAGAGAVRIRSTPE
jgi:putative oxidoreductase